MQLARAASEGGRGEMDAFRKDKPWPLLDSTIAEVAAGKRSLDANLGPELWIVNSGFKIAPAMWSNDRSLLLTMNLNTVTEPELLTIPGIDIGTARKIVAARNAKGFFTSISDMNVLLPPDTFQRLTAMAEEMKHLSPYGRE